MNMMMMPMKMKVYATTDVPFDLAAYMSKVYGTSSSPSSASTTRPQAR